MLFKNKTKIGIQSGSIGRTSFSVSIVKGESFQEPHSFHSADDLICIMPAKRMLRYKAIGINPNTNRKKTIRNIVVASWKAFPEKISGIDPPYEFILDMRPVTERQQSVFVRNGIRVSKDMSLDDASVVISHIVSDTESKPCRYFEPPLPSDIMECAAEKKILLPSFLSVREAKLYLAGKKWRKDL